MKKLETALNYFMWCWGEEGIFRFTALMLLPNKWGIAIATIVYALVHFVGFRWPMVVASFLLGIGLTYLWSILPLPFNYILCVMVHFVVGGAAYKMGLTNKWKNNWFRR